MRTKCILSVIFILIGSSALADNTTQNAATEELMQFMEAHKAFAAAKQGFRSMFMGMRNADSDLNAEEKAIEEKHINKLFGEMDKKVTWDTVKPSYVAVFEEVFTEAERKDILAFYKSPAGKAFKEKFPFLSLRLIQVGQQAYGAAIMELEEIGKQIEEDMKKEIEELRAKKK